MGLGERLRDSLLGASGASGAPGEQAGVRHLMQKAGAPASLVELAAADADWLAPVLAPREGIGGEPWARWLEREQAIHTALAGGDDDRRRAAVAYVYAAYVVKPPKRFTYYSSPQEAVISKTARRRLPWSLEEVGWLLTATASITGNQLHYLPHFLTLPVIAASKVADNEVDALAQPLQSLFETVQRSPLQGAERASALRRVTEQLERAQPSRGTGLPDDVLGNDDTFGRGAREALLEHFDAATAGAALRLLSRYGTGVSPNQKWQREADGMGSAGDLLAVSEVLLRLCLRHREAPVEHQSGRHTWTETVFASPSTATVLRAAAWVVARQVTPERLGLVGDVAVHCGTGLGGSGGTARCGQVTTTAVASLASAAADPLHATEVVGQLARIRDRVQNKTILKTVQKAIDAAAAAAGLTPGQLLERAVPTFGLEPDGTAQVLVGEHAALLALRSGPAGAKLDIRWRTPTGREVTSVPAGVKEQHAEAVTGLRATAGQVKKAAATQRQRLEDLLAVGRTWPADDWATYYPVHPVVGLWARQLIWQVRPVDASAATDAAATTDAGTATDREPGWASGLPSLDAGRGSWVLTSHDGTVTPVGAHDEVRLWHPIRQPLADVQAWRTHLTDVGLRQPFKQAFREIYLLTPAEEATGTYSNRFAAHVVRAPQLGALVRARGWSSPHLGYWDGGWNATATKVIGEDGWRASFDYALVENDQDGYETPSLAATDQVRLERWEGPRTGGGWRAQPMSDVPALVFSEAMRDIDLFVGVTSIAADPTWADRGTAGQRDYWHATSFGDLTESAQVRREAVAALLPRTKLRDRARLDGNFLVVSGHLRDYKIHLGSTNILMSPADTYLCIVPAPGQKDPGVFLPFEEGGGKLSVIWSKAFLLAEDTSITDPTITRQLHLGLEDAPSASSP